MIIELDLKCHVQRMKFIKRNQSKEMALSFCLDSASSKPSHVTSNSSGLSYASKKCLYYRSIWKCSIDDLLEHLQEIFHNMSYPLEKRMPLVIMVIEREVST